MISDDPSIEAGLLYAGYPSTTVQGIRDWFGTRNVCDDDNFKNFFLRLANPLAPKYLAQLRMETVDKNFDPLVENYLERYTENGGEDTHKPAGFTVDKHPIEYTKLTKPADIHVSDSPAETTITEKPAETKTEKTPIGYTDTYEPRAKYGKSGTIKRKDNPYEDTTVSDNDTKGLSKQNPMSSTSVNTGSGPSGSNISGEVQGLNWSYSSAQEQATVKGYNKITHNVTGYGEETYDNFEEGGKSGSDTTTRTYASGDKEIIDFKQGTKAGSKSLEVDNAGVKETKYGNATTAGIDKNNEALGFEKMIMDYMGSETTRYSNDEKNTYGKTYKERYTGRAGLTPQQALTEAITYLRTISPAFFDLMMKLEPAFLGVYDV